MDINQKITEELGVKKWQVDAAVTLIDEGNTIPFIARYRKEATGTLDDEQLRSFMRGLHIFEIWKKKGTGSCKHRGAGEAYRRIEASDPFGRNVGSSGRSV